MSAEVNGKAWNSSIVAAATYQNQFFGLSGIDAGGTGITLGIANVTGPGAYTLNFMNGNGSSGIVANSSGQGWTPFPRVARALSPSPP
ncbi:MAG: hypothetical protein FJ316_04390 [SAR202 cluster bacterium]|nr:hypothetical protein [SAR202 cluster bacterium]